MPQFYSMFTFNETLEQARERNIRDALLEDVGICDWTAQLIPSPQTATARVLVREAAVLCGCDWFTGCMQAVNPAVQVQWHYSEGQLMQPNTDVCHIQGDARAILTAERSALNFLQLLSATATITRRHADVVAQATSTSHTNANSEDNGKASCIVLDTRKTIPGLRQAQKYAVRTGGGHNQRMALWHGILIKENHIAAAGGIAQALARARALPPFAADDLVAFRSAGAYGAVMASEYNTRPLVPEVLVSGARWSVVRARPSLDEIIARDSVPDWLAADR